MFVILLAACKQPRATLKWWSPILRYDALWFHFQRFVLAFFLQFQVPNAASVQNRIRTNGIWTFTKLPHLYRKLMTIYQTTIINFVIAQQMLAYRCFRICDCTLPNGHPHRDTYTQNWTEQLLLLWLLFAIIVQNFPGHDLYLSVSSSEMRERRQDGIKRRERKKWGRIRTK